MEGIYKNKLQLAALAALVLLSIFLALLSVSQLVNLRYIGAGIAPANTITVSGKGEVFATPDIATFSYSVNEERDTVTAAQEASAKKTNDILAYLKKNGVAEKDIQTGGYNVYPNYQYEQQICPAYSICPPGRQVLKGYQVNQSVTVKVRDIGRAGELLSGVGKNGATNISGLTFSIDDQDAVNAQARTEAIADAKAKARELGKELGVSLVRVVSFSENGNYPGPLMYAMSAGKGGGEGSPEIPAGQNDIVSNVTITYEIR